MQSQTRRQLRFCEKSGMGALIEMVNNGVNMGSRYAPAEKRRGIVISKQSLIGFFVGASRLALRGLGVAVVMGVVFGLLIGIGGTMLGIETKQLYVVGGLSGWVSSFIAMAFIVLQMRRDRNASR